MTSSSQPTFASSLPVWQRRVALGGGVLALSLLTACASGPNADPRDPLEPYNRTMTKFNDKVDQVIYKPVAQGYKAVTPQFVRTGVTNFFGNLGDMWSMVNNALQGKGEAFGDSMGRVMVNSFIGIGGLFDVATEAGIERHKEDFGQTLGAWGVPSGPYFVIPFLGPSTVRDGTALFADWWGHPVSHVNDIPWRNSLTALNFVNARANLLAYGNLLDEAALDPYTFKRDAFLQKRENDVHDGDPPQSEERYDLPESGSAPASSEAPPPAGDASAAAKNEPVAASAAAASAPVAPAAEQASAPAGAAAAEPLAAASESTGENQSVTAPAVPASGAVAPLPAGSATQD